MNQPTLKYRILHRYPSHCKGPGYWAVYNWVTGDFIESFNWHYHALMFVKQLEREERAAI